MAFDLHYVYWYSPGERKMSYARFGLMILTSTVVMFVLMYLNTYAWEHVFFSETRMYMAILMGAAMAIVMLGFMAGMYPNRELNTAIFAGSVLVLGVSLWLVRSQISVADESYMRAMIPHHSIAIMTSERARIRDRRVRKLADDVIAAQQKEIAEMRYLIAQVADSRYVREVYEDPPPRPGSIDDALRNTLVAALDPGTISSSEAEAVLASDDGCRLDRNLETDPILRVSANGTAAAMKLNGILIRLEQGGVNRFTAPGVTVTLRPLQEGEADWRANAELVFALDAGPVVGYWGFYDCENGA
jgi:hypothetical protein